MLRAYNYYYLQMLYNSIQILNEILNEVQTQADTQVVINCTRYIIYSCVKAVYLYTITHVCSTVYCPLLIYCSFHEHYKYLGEKMMRVFDTSAVQPVLRQIAESLLPNWREHFNLSHSNYPVLSPQTQL